MTNLEEEEFKRKFNLKLWKEILLYGMPSKKLLVFLAIIMVGVGGIDAIFPLMNKYAIDNFVTTGNIKGLYSFGTIYFVLVLLQAINVWLLIDTSGKIQTQITYNIRKKAFKHLQELSFSYFDTTQVGWIMSRMTSDTQKLGDIVAWGLVDMIWGLTMMVVIICAMLYLNLKLATITLSVVPVVIVMSMYFQKKMLKSHRQVRKINSKITGAFNEGIMGARTTKTLSREDKNLEEFKEHTSEMKLYSIRATVLSSLYQPIVITLGSIGTGIALWFGGKSVLMEVIGYGTLVAFISYTVQFFEPLRELARVFSDLQSAQASAERILYLLNTELEIKDKDEVIEKYGDTFNPKKENWTQIEGNISFKDVSFSYKTGEKILENFNFEVKSGQTVALVGETGSGKSTIVNLACRFYEPTKGEILIDGVDYRERSQLWLHSNLGYVLQSPELFSGTIKENIVYGNLDASELDIIKAAKLVNAHEFIKDLEKGYDTEVGEGGSRLSTGQKQLISFARAVLGDPRIFVLDEATSSIDTETEKIIQDALQKVLKGRTSFIIAHRLSTIKSSDCILVIKKGKIVEKGTHQELLKLKGYYYRLYTNQFKEEQEAKILHS